jgi:hypothetical protein
MRTSASASFFTVAFAVSGLAHPAVAGITTWTNNNGGTFNVAANWSEGVPGPSDTAQFLSLNAYLVTVTQSAAVDRMVIRSASPSMKLNGQVLTLLGNDRSLPSLAIGPLGFGVSSLNISGGTLVATDVVLSPDGGSGSVTLGGVFGGGHMQCGSVVVGAGASATFAVSTNSSLKTDLLTLGHKTNAPVGISFTSSVESVVYDRLEIGVQTGAQCLVSFGKLTVEGDVAAALEPGGSATINVSGTTGLFRVLGACDLGIAGATTVGFATGGRMVVEGPFTASGATTLQFRLESASTSPVARLELKGPVEFYLGDTDAVGSSTTISAILPTPAIPPIGTLYHMISSIEPVTWPIIDLPATTLTRRYSAQATPHSLDILVAAGLADLNGDNAVTLDDLSVLLDDWGTRGSVADLNGDGIVNGYDLGLFLSVF